MVAYVQRTQDPETGVFHEPFTGDENTPAMIAFLRSWGYDPLYPRNPLVPTAREPVHPYTIKMTVDPPTHVELVRTDTWDYPWAIGSHACVQQLHLLALINNGREDLIPTLEESLHIVLSHQNPETGMWGDRSIGVDQQIGGALKIIGRLQWGMRLVLPHVDKLADSIIELHHSREWYARQHGAVVLRNVGEMIQACLSASDYRREELEKVLVEMVDECHAYMQEDGGFSARRFTTDGPFESDAMGFSVVCVSCWPRDLLWGNQDPSSWREQKNTTSRWIVRLTDDLHAQVIPNPDYHPPAEP
jgi:hypothetical protein